MVGFLFERVRTTAEILSADEVVNVVEPDEADEDQVDRHDEVQQPRHDQDQDSGEKGNNRRNVGDGDGHAGLLVCDRMIMTMTAAGSNDWTGLLEFLKWRMFLSANRSPLRRNMR
jgi:hypothetical protein